MVPPAQDWNELHESEDPATVRLNWRIIQAPKPLIDYVFVHELCHLVHRDHRREFWAMLGQVTSDYDDRKKRLKHLGGGLIW